MQQTVQRCAMHWRRKTKQNRGKQQQIARKQLLVDAQLMKHKVMSKEDKKLASLHSKNASQTFPTSVVHGVSPPAVSRPQPRIPDYLRESFNLSELSEHPSVLDTEAVPRTLPPNIQPVTQPEHLPKQTVPTNSLSSRTSSINSQTGFKEVVPLKSSSRKPQVFSKKNGSGKKHVLLPPSSFQQTKKPERTSQVSPQGT